MKLSRSPEPFNGDATAAGTQGHMCPQPPPGAHWLTDVVPFHGSRGRNSREGGLAAKPGCPGLACGSRPAAKAFPCGCVSNSVSCCSFERQCLLWALCSLGVKERGSCYHQLTLPRKGSTAFRGWGGVAQVQTCSIRRPAWVGEGCGGRGALILPCGCAPTVYRRNLPRNFPRMLSVENGKP